MKGTTWIQIFQFTMQPVQFSLPSKIANPNSCTNGEFVKKPYLGLWAMEEEHECPWSGP